MTFAPTIRSQADLETAWRTLMGPLGFSRHSIWLMLIDAEDHPIPQLTQVDDTERPPTPEQVAGLAEVLADLGSGFAGGRVAFLVSRPGGPGLLDTDRAWASALHEAGRRAGVPVDVVHRASDADLVPIPLDEVLPRGA